VSGRFCEPPLNRDSVYDEEYERGWGKRKTPLNFLQAGRTAGPEQRRGRSGTTQIIPTSQNVSSSKREKKKKSEF
jgi:hypothetical protein